MATILYLSVFNIKNVTLYMCAFVNRDHRQTLQWLPAQGHLGQNIAQCGRRGAWAHEASTSAASAGLY